jgi:hypothetical protein
MPNNCKSPEMCLLSETCVPCAICPNAKEKANDRLALTTGSADVVDQLKRLADDWFARAVDEMNGAVKEKNARDGMNFYQHTARAAVLSDCRKQLMEIILPNNVEAPNA